MATLAKKRSNTQTYRFEPVGMDVYSPCSHELRPGTLVRKTQPVECPRNGTMGHTYVEDARTGEFYGLVLTASLVKGASI